MSRAPAWTRVRITARHWHYGLVVLLCVVNLVLGVRLVYAWRRAQVGNAAHLQQREAEYRAVQLKTMPLRGLDKKIPQAQQDEQNFYDRRFPATYSKVLEELGSLAVKNNVMLSRVQYEQGKLGDGVYGLRMNASLTGDYTPIVRFINDLERDKVFFRIDGIALNGQQGGVVSLRMLLTTYLRAPAPNPNSSIQPVQGKAAASSAVNRAEAGSSQTTLASADIPAGKGRP